VTCPPPCRSRVLWFICEPRVAEILINGKGALALKSSCHIKETTGEVVLGLTGSNTSVAMGTYSRRRTYPSKHEGTACDFELPACELGRDDQICEVCESDGGKCIEPTSNMLRWRCPQVKPCRG
jgi:hypothetical protein